jgi:hypothetical protein
VSREPSFGVQIQHTGTPLIEKVSERSREVQLRPLADRYLVHVLVSSELTTLPALPRSAQILPGPPSSPAIRSTYPPGLLFEAVIEPEVGPM